MTPVDRGAATNRLAALAAAMLLGGCAAMQTYDQAGRYVAPGGVGDQQRAAALADLQREQVRTAALQEERLQREREIARSDERLKALEQDIGRQNRQLAEAVGARRVSQQRAAELQREMDAVRNEMQQIDRQNRAAQAAAAANAPPDPAAERAKQDRLKALEARKAALEATLVQLGTRR